MTILVDIRSLTKDWYSGIGNYTRSLVDEFLSRKGNKYQLFYNGLKKHPLPDSWRSNPSVEIIDWRLPNKALDFSSRFFREPKIDRLFSPDLVFSPHFNLLNVKKMPRVLTVHDLSFVRQPYFFTARKRFWHWQQDVPRQIKNASHIIAVSEFTKADIIDYFKIPAERVSVIYSGIDRSLRRLSELNEELIDFRKKRELDRPFILYLGAFEPRKNIISLIRAFNILKKEAFYRDWRLVLAGGSRWLDGDLDKEAGSSPFSGDIIFLEKISDEEKVLLYNSAKVFVYPSFFEGFGFPPLEAQACGVPVVSSDRASLPEILGDSALLFNPWRLKELYLGVKTLTQDSAVREKMIKLGLDNASRFSWEKSARETLEIFSETI